MFAKQRIKFICILLLFQVNSLAQVPINGFCQLESFHFSTSISKFLPCNFNNDSYTDILIVDEKSNKISVIEGEENNNFKMKYSGEMPAQMSAISMMNHHKMNEFSFLSRKSKKAGLLKLNSSGGFSSHVITTFDSNPAFLNSGDTDGDSLSEIVVSGSGFDGLAIVSGDNKPIKKISHNRITYSDPLFADLNNDSFLDLAAYNLRSGKIDCFYNNSRGEFKFTRSIMVPSLITQLKSFDYNLDNYTDLSFVCQNRLHFILGDSVNSFYTQKIAYLHETPAKYIYGDFNRDGKIDIMYLNSKHNKVSILFQKDNLEFYPEIVYYTGENITDINPFYSKFLNGAAISLLNGDFFIIHTFNLFGEKSEICLGAPSAVLMTFDYGNDGLKDIMYMDNSAMTVNFIVRDKNGIPSRFYSFALPETYAECKIDDSKPYLKTLICLQKDKNRIEVFNVDFLNSKMKNTLFFDVPNMVHFNITGKENPGLSILSRKKGILQFHTINSINANATEKKYEICVDSLQNATIGNDNIIYYTYLAHDTVYFANWRPLLNKWDVFHKKSMKGMTSVLGNFVGDLLNDDKDRYFMVYRQKEKLEGILSKGFDKEIESNSGKKLENDILNSTISYFGNYKNSGLNKLFLYSNITSRFYKIDFIRRKSKIILSEIGNLENVSNFIVEKMTGSHFYIISTSNNKYTITFEKI